MIARQSQDWDPFSTQVAENELNAYDAMRERCPVAYSEPFGWTLFRHEHISRVLENPGNFSNRVSRHLSLPNGTDPPEHTAYRRLIESFFTPEQVAALEPRCRAIAEELIDECRARRNIEFIEEFARPYTARAQCAFLGWPERLSEPLYRWSVRNQQATRARDRQALSTIAREFEDYVLVRLRARRTRPVKDPSGDVTARLMAGRVQGRSLTDEEIVSLLRNWTVGEVATLSASIGILAHFLAVNPDHQQQLRSDPSRIPAANEEILRLHGPLVANRRMTTQPVNIGGRRIEAGEPVQLNWIAANRDPEIFEQPAEFRLDRDRTPNLLWGKGIHVCPGAPLARMEMRVAMETLLAEFRRMEPDPDHPSVPALYPASGCDTLPLQLR